jgi:TusA-related sulfurtransferase
MGKQVQTDDPRFVRDIESKALLNTDHNALQQHRQQKVYFENQQKDINIMKVQIEHLTKVTEEMIEIKTLLRNFK